MTRTPDTYIHNRLPASAPGIISIFMRARAHTLSACGAALNVALERIAERVCDRIVNGRVHAGWSRPNDLVYAEEEEVGNRRPASV